MEKKSTLDRARKSAIKNSARAGVRAVRPEEISKTRRRRADQRSRWVLEMAEIVGYNEAQEAMMRTIRQRG